MRPAKITSLVLLSLMMVSQSSNSQTTAFLPTLVRMVAAPVDVDTIDLYDKQDGTNTEVWDLMNGERIVRNVSVPTLTPFLPDSGKATGAAVIVAPGGGFLMLSMDNEGYQVAKWLAAHGVAAFVLKYRLDTSPVEEARFLQALGALLGKTSGADRTDLPFGANAVVDAQAAIRMVRQRSAQYHVDPNRIGMLGFSAGAMTTLATLRANDPLARMNFAGLIYGPMNAVTIPADAPPAFMALASDDPIFGSHQFELFDVWRKAGISAELHLFAHGSHGFGSHQQGTTSDLWMLEYFTWLKSGGYLGQVN